jgi:uncharacterized protein
MCTNNATPIEKNTLLYAAKSGDFITISDRLETNQDVNLNPGNNVTTLAKAVECNQNDNLKMLFDKGVNVNLLDIRGKTAIFDGDCNEHETVIMLLKNIGLNRYDD